MWEKEVGAEPRVAKGGEGERMIAVSGCVCERLLQKNMFPINTCVSFCATVAVFLFFPSLIKTVMLFLK